MDFKRFTPFYRPHLRLLTLDLVCAVLTAGLDLTLPIFSRQIINDYIPHQNLRLIILITILLFGLYLMRLLMAYIMSYWGHIMGKRIERDIRSTLFQHIQTLPFKYFDDTKTGQLMSRFLGDLREIGELAHHGPEDIFVSVLTIGGCFIILLILNPLLTFSMFAFVAILVTFTMKFRHYTINTFRDVKNGHAERY